MLMFSANILMDYAAKIQSIRLVVSLPSVFFLNDLTQFIRSILATLGSLATVPVRKRTAANQPLSQAEWANGVLDKLYDYERWENKL